ncbi:MAG: purine-nucleoside phosphorylase [Planctomycetota bacterium]|jgi:purine-nucleoside phosphorylase|nr:purine-nucleoside phosphorylase [Planctomycetota bacterium]
MTPLCDRIEEAANALRAHSDQNPQIGIILGTGLGNLAESIDVRATVPFQDIPHFPASTATSHVGNLLFGQLEGKEVVAMQGRLHAYEGYTAEEITLPVRVMKALGMNTLLISNACGGLNPQYQAGDIMFIEDHINLLGINPLVGPNDDQLGPRWPDMIEPYNTQLIELAERLALEGGLKTQRGVYVAVLGPNLETRAEYRFLRTIGADVVGMSTVPEVIVAVHQGTRVLGFSIVTDMCLPDALEPANVDKILAVAGEAEPRLTLLVRQVIQNLAT